MDLRGEAGTQFNSQPLCCKLCSEQDDRHQPDLGIGFCGPVGGRGEAGLGKWNDAHGLDVVWEVVKHRT